MKRMRLEPQTQSSNPRKLFFTLVMSLMLTSISLAQLEQTKIAFRSDRDGQGEIYVINSDGTGLQNLTNRSGGSLPAWSPDGRKIAFLSTRDGNFEIYVMNSNGANIIRLTAHPEVDRDPDWSPDGKRIAFASWRTGDGEIYVMKMFRGLTPKQR